MNDGIDDKLFILIKLLQPLNILNGTFLIVFILYQGFTIFCQQLQIAFLTQKFKIKIIKIKSIKQNLRDTSIYIRLIIFYLQTFQSTKMFKQKPHTVISHRGVCSIFPENTKEAIIAGIYCSHLTQFDIQFTKDHQIVVFHDRTLSRVTNIKDHPQFLSRRKIQKIDDYQDPKDDWWLRDFTFQQLKRLKVFQPIAYRPQFQSANFKISSLQEVIQQVLNITKKDIHKNKLNSGLLIEIKEQVALQITQKDRLMCEKLIQLLKKYGLDTLEGCKQNNLKVVIQSFNLKVLQGIKNCENSIIQLYDKDIQITKELLQKNRGKNVKGIGITFKNLLDQQGIPSKRVKQLCLSQGYQLFYWTIRDDDKNSLHFGCQNYKQFYQKLAELGVNGFITQFPDKCRGILGLEATQYLKGNLQTDLLNKKQDQNQRKISDCSSKDSWDQEFVGIIEEFYS